MTPASPDYLLLADSIGKSFWGNAVLKSATMWAQPGVITVLFGLNGSGKTTLIRCALGLLRANHGMVRYDGRSYLRPQLHRLAQLGVFYVPDRGLLSRRLRVDRQVRLVSDRFEASDTEEWLERLGVSHVLRNSAHTLSGGERKRLELAMAGMRKPRCLILDEPLTEIEPKDRRFINGVLREMSEEGCAIVVTGHDVDDLMALADDVIWVVGGTTHGLGTTEEAKAHHQFRREYIGPRGS
jgi:ABC-type multidrug transport system ATPase subunit